MPDPDQSADDLDLSTPEAREHYRLAVAVAQAAWDWTASRDEDRALLLGAALHQLRRHELRVGPKLLVHPMTRSRG